MRDNFPGIIKSLGLTLAILFVLEVLNTTFLPLVGLSKFNFAFNILIVLFIGFKVESSYQAIYILIVQYFHSFFSVEGWEAGVIAGIIICIIISYMKEVLHLVNFVTTIFVTYIFQLIWFAVSASLIYLKIQNVEYITDKLWRFLGEGFVLALLAPIFFSILDKIWNVGKEDGLKQSL